MSFELVAADVSTAAQPDGCIQSWSCPGPDSEDPGPISKKLIRACMHSKLDNYGAIPALAVMELLT